MKTTLKTILEEFDKKFIFMKGKEEDLLVAQPGTAPYVRAFITQSIKDALEACRVEEIPHIYGEGTLSRIEIGGWNNAATQYDENVKSFLGEK